MAFEGIVIAQKDMQYWGVFYHSFTKTKRPGLMTWKTYDSKEFPGSERFHSKDDPIRVDEIPANTFVNWPYHRFFIHNGYKRGHLKGVLDDRDEVPVKLNFIHQEDAFRAIVVAEKPETNVCKYWGYTSYKIQSDNDGSFQTWTVEETPISDDTVQVEIQFPKKVKSIPKQAQICERPYEVYFSEKEERNTNRIRNKVEL